MQPLEKITQIEKYQIDVLRKDFAFSSDANSTTGRFCPVNDLLTYWNKNKQFLFKAFGNELILEKEVTYKKDLEELSTEIRNNLCRSHEVFFNNFVDWVENQYGYRSGAYNSALVGDLYLLINSSTLAKNKWEEETFYITLPNDKKFKIQRGSSVIKSLAKLASAFNIEGFEDFRIKHSQYLNQKSLHGTLCLSIHPLDYMTMSDNNCDWDSCMSWSNEGSYRQGTVEMMNSKNVIVAYLKSSEDMPIYYIDESGDYNRAKGYWSNKKWRQLFVVDENVISGIKAYPYPNNYLTTEVVNWLLELTDKNLNWKYEEPVWYNYRINDINNHFVTKEENPEDRVEYNLDFITGNMYNDFGATECGHYTAIKKDMMKEDLVAKWNGRYVLEVCYSGESQCMVCGRSDDDFANESCLACYYCQSFSCCECCGEYDSELYEIDGELLCSNCWDDRVYTCEECEDEHLKENLEILQIIPRLTEADKEYISEIPLSRKENDANRIYGTSIEDLDYIPDARWYHYNCTLRFCGLSCIKNWIETNCREGVRPICRLTNRASIYTVYFDELTKEAQKYYFGSEVDSNEKYRERFEDYVFFPSRVIEIC